LASCPCGGWSAALKAGQACCTVAQAQDRLLLEKSGFHMLFDMTTLGIPNAQGVIAANRKFAKENPEIVQRFMDSLIESIARAKKDKPGSLPVLKAQLKLDDDAVVAATYDFFIDEVVPSVPTPKAEQFARGIAIMSQFNDKLQGFNIAPYIDPSFLEKSIARGLDKPQ
jgi:ABC-type nitrate/sulfonate/bicarbonate transport system substrate-binding protein